jgi:ribosomal protein S18 acetylase RimI-like enzyme
MPNQAINLSKPNAEEFRAIREYALNDYTHDGKVGTWPAAEIAQQEFDRLLPNGLDTENQHLLSVRIEGDAHVGFLFLTIIQRMTGPEAFILDLVIFQNFRRKGYGEEALLQLEQYVSELGLKTISLSVFHHNEAAQALYRKIDYSPVFTRMTKKLKANVIGVHPL